MNLTQHGLKQSNLNWSWFNRIMIEAISQKEIHNNALFERIRAWVKWPTFYRWHFQFNYHDRKMLYFDSNVFAVRFQNCQVLNQAKNCQVLNQAMDGCLIGNESLDTVYPKKHAHGFCFAVLCCGYTLTDCPISIRLTSLALWQSNDCPSASKATLMNMDRYLMWIHYEWLHNHNKAKHNKTVCIFLGIYCR